MTETLRETIKTMSSSANPTAELFDKLLQGWDTYFSEMSIQDSRQDSEFDGIIRARVMSGSISLLAPGQASLLP